jgi:membrane-bound lytic murein transglycosylase B
MTRWGAIILTAAIAFGMQAGGVSAQTPPATPQTATEPITAKPDRTTADKQTRQQMAERRAALKQKRVDCGKQADAQRLHLLKRSRFIRQCMAG